MIRWSTTIVVLLLAAVAAIVSYRHAYEVITVYGESGWVAYLVPLTIDGLIFASSMVLLDAARRGVEAPKLAYWTLGLGILATLAANVTHGWAHGVVGSIVAAWPAIALVLSYELLMTLIRRSANAHHGSDPVQVHAPAVPAQVDEPRLTDEDLERLLRDDDAPEAEVQPEPVPEADADAPYRPVAVAHFLAEVAQGQTPTVRTIQRTMNVSTDRAGRLRRYLAGLVQVTQ